MIAASEPQFRGTGVSPVLCARVAMRLALLLMFAILPLQAQTSYRTTAKEQVKTESQLAQQFLIEDRRCRDAAKLSDPRAAEIVCRSAIEISERLGESYSIEKMRSNEFLGHLLVRQDRFAEALDSYNHAIVVAGTRLTEKDAELARLYGDLAVTYHLMGDLDHSRQYYKKAESGYQAAYQSIGVNESDEIIRTLRQEYMTSLSKLLEYHLRATQEAHDRAEEAEVRALILRVRSRIKRS